MSDEQPLAFQYLQAFEQMPESARPQLREVYEFFQEWYDSTTKQLSPQQRDNHVLVVSRHGGKIHSRAYASLAEARDKITASKPEGPYVVY